MVFGERIKQLRLEHKWTQEYVCEKLNISAGALSRYETSMYEPKSLKLVTDFASLFNVSTDYLMGVTNIREPIDGLNTSNLDKEGKKHVYNVYEAMQKQKELDEDEQEFRFAYHKEMEGLTDEEIVNALRFYKEMKNKINKNNN